MGEAVEMKKIVLHVLAAILGLIIGFAISSFSNYMLNKMIDERVHYILEKEGLK